MPLEKAEGSPSEVFTPPTLLNLSGVERAAGTNLTSPPFVVSYVEPEVPFVVPGSYPPNFPVRPILTSHDESFKHSLPEGSVNIFLPEPRSTVEHVPLHHRLFGVVRSVSGFAKLYKDHSSHRTHTEAENDQKRTSVPKEPLADVSTVNDEDEKVPSQNYNTSVSKAHRNGFFEMFRKKRSRLSLPAINKQSKQAQKNCFLCKGGKKSNGTVGKEHEKDNLATQPALTNDVILVGKPSGKIVRKVFFVDPGTGTSVLDSWLWSWIMGDAPGFSSFTTAQRGTKWWYPLVFIDYCRGAGRIVRVNNPWSGIIFIIAMAIQDVYQLIFAALGAASASAVAWCLNTPTIRYKNGAIYFNGFLLGLFIWNNGNYNPQDATAWWCIVPVVFFGVMSAFVKNALDGVCNMYRVPVSSLPYGLLVLCYLGSQLSTPHPAFPGNGVPIPNGLDVPAGYRMETIFHGIFFSISQVFYCGNLASVVLCWFAVFLNSPLHCMMLMLGAAIGTYIATLLGVLPLQLYTGMWSFNSMLAMSYLGGHFWVLNGWAFPIACVAAAFATILCGLFYHVLGSLKLPFCGLPFFLSLSTFLLVASGTDMSFFIHRVRMPTFHERHLVDYLEHKSSNPAPSLYKDKKKFRLPVLSLVFEGQTTLDSVREEIRPFMKNEIEHEMQESALRKAAAEIPSFMPKSKS